MRRFWSIVVILGLALTGLIARPGAVDAGIGCPPPATCAAAGVLSASGIIPADKSSLSLFGTVVIAGNHFADQQVSAGTWSFQVNAGINVTGPAQKVTGSGFVYMADATFSHAIFSNVTIGGTLGAMTLKASGFWKITALAVRVGGPGALGSALRRRRHRQAVAPAALAASSSSHPRTPSADASSPMAR